MSVSCRVSRQCRLAIYGDREAFFLRHNSSAHILASSDKQHLLYFLSKLFIRSNLIFLLLHSPVLSLYVIHNKLIDLYNMGKCSAALTSVHYSRRQRQCERALTLCAISNAKPPEVVDKSKFIIKHQHIDIARGVRK